MNKIFPSIVAGKFLSPTDSRNANKATEIFHHKRFCLLVAKPTFRKTPNRDYEGERLIHRKKG